MMKRLYPNCFKQTIRHLACLMVIFMLGSVVEKSAHAQIATSTPASRCGEGSLVLQATATSGTIKWYTVPFYGTAIVTGVSGDGTTFTTPSQIVTTAYYVDAVDATNCSLNPGSVRVPVLATISSNSIQASIFYASTTFCKSVATAQEVTRTGTAGGVFSYTGSGGNTLTINTSTGAITPSASSVGTYTVTYTVTATEGCIESPASTTVIIATAPLTSSIAYAGSPYCTSLSSATVTLTNPNSGIYSAEPSGLIIDDSSGEINPSLSEPGTYTVTYVVSGAGGCAPQEPTATVTITGLPTATITYAEAPFCKDLGSAQTPTLSGTGAFTGGTFTASGITINPSSGAVTPSTSNAGTYTIYYTAPASGNCATVQVSTPLTINPLPTASIAGTTSVCQNAAEPNITFTGLTGTAPFTFTYTVGSGANQTVTTSSGNSVTVAQPTVSAGAYLYTLVNVADANNCSQAASGTTTVTVTGTPVADFSYIGSPFCKTGTVSPTFAPGGSAGTFSGTDVTFVSTSTGEINLASTPAGTYEITNTISSCGTPVVATSSVTINALPTATISGTTACGSSVLTAATNATAPAYTWYKDDVVIPNEIASTLTASANGAYKVKVTDGSNGCEFTSLPSTVTIIALPTASITGTLTTCNAATTITAVSDANLPSYVWYKNDEVISDQTGSTLTVNVDIPANSAPKGSGNYKVKVSNGVTSCENTSVAVFVSIALIDSPGRVDGGQTVCTDAANSTTLYLRGTKSTLLRWEKSVSPFSEWVAISPTQTDSIYTATGLTQTTKFRGAVQNGICDEAYSTPATITVVADPTLSQPGNTTLCVGGSTILWPILSGGTGTYNYQWKYSANGTTNWTNITNGTPAGITYTGSTSVEFGIYGGGTESLQNNYYKCVLTLTDDDGCGCSDTETLPITVTVVADPSWASITQPATTITYGSSVTFSATVSGGQGGTISWIRSTTSGGAGTTVTSPDTPPATGTYYYRPYYAPTGWGCNLADGTETTVTVSPKALTITATGPTKIYGTALTAGTSAINFTAGATGVGTETVTSVTLTPDAAGLSAATTGGSAYVVTPSLATGTNSFLASNYTITYTAYNGTVAKAESTIAATGTTSFTYSAGVPQGPATVDQTGSTGAVTYSYVGTGSTTYTASATKPTDPGTYTVTATVAADTNYNGKTSVAYAFNIIPLAPTGSAAQSFCSEIIPD
jgi:hypothetical protein